MTQTDEDPTRVRITDRYTAFLITKKPNNGYDPYVGQWALWDEGATVGIFPTAEDARAWALAQRTPIERMAITLFSQECGITLERAENDWDEVLEDQDCEDLIQHARELLAAWKNKPCHTVVPW